MASTEMRMGECFLSLLDDRGGQAVAAERDRIKAATDDVGLAIRFALGECSLGSVLVAATEAGICAILLGDSRAALLRDLEDRFPQAELVGGGEALAPVVADVVGFIEAPAQGLDLPLDPCGTAFQRRVWQALREIPAGSTASYSEIAEHIGAPGEAYAVGEACAANMIAVAVPCHRVVRKDGTLAGYRWGFRRKRALLKREGAR
jgi:AraC family transcriptional regulator, regulatory protein of adaptative response / methylated-DNA-[protein]-cysteine methyltransferase